MLHGDAGPGEIDAVEHRLSEFVGEMQLYTLREFVPIKDLIEVVIPLERFVGLPRQAAWPASTPDAFSPLDRHGTSRGQDDPAARQPRDTID